MDPDPYVFGPPGSRSAIICTSVVDPDPDPRVMGLPDPDTLVRDMDPDPDPSIIMQKY